MILQINSDILSHQFPQDHININLPYTRASSRKCEASQIVATYYSASCVPDCLAGLHTYSSGTHASKDWCTNQVQSSSVDNPFKIGSPIITELEKIQKVFKTCNFMLLIPPSRSLLES
jgi:hypothetical protein